MKKRVCDATVAVLKRTDNQSVMTRDEHLLHEIAEEMGWDHNAWFTSRRVIAALSKTPGNLIKYKSRFNTLIFKLNDM